MGFGKLFTGIKQTRLHSVVSAILIAAAFGVTTDAARADAAAAMPLGESHGAASLYWSEAVEMVLDADPRDVGTPQGGPLSPILANLFLHYALDRWLATRHASVPFCRYADDGILHCRDETEANYLREQLDARLRDCGLELHPGKTRVVYCKDCSASIRMRSQRQSG